LSIKKILITGYPHSGTSILKSKFGECKNLYEHPFETDVIKQEHINAAGNKEFILIKYPILPLDIRVHGPSFIGKEGSLYKDYIVIFVIRNPYNLYTGVIKAGSDPLNKIDSHLNAEYHAKVSEYLVSAEMFKEARDNNYPNVYAIRYEDFFPNNYQKLKELMNKIGLQYDDSIFDNKSKDYIHWQNINYSKIDKNNIDYKKNRFEYRTWQINQPFQNMNSEVNIPDELSDILKNSNIIQELGYSDPRITG
jgi:hypothetical protein